jgi:hypothetical protein
MTIIHPDDVGFTYSTDTEWDRQDAYERGAANPERAWISTDRDVWHKNPFYQGPPVRHPEDDSEDGDYLEPQPFRSIETYGDDDIPF